MQEKSFAHKSFIRIKNVTFIEVNTFIFVKRGVSGIIESGQLN